MKFFSWLKQAYLAIKFLDYDKVEMAELLEINVKMGRRAAYDLNHVVSMLHPRDREVPEETRQRLARKADHYITLFNPGRGLKDYRLKLYGEIYDLERRVDTLVKICEDNKLEPYGPDDIPF